MEKQYYIMAIQIVYAYILLVEVVYMTNCNDYYKGPTSEDNFMVQL